MASGTPSSRLGTSRAVALFGLGCVLGGLAPAYPAALVVEEVLGGSAPPAAGIAWPPEVLKGVYLSFWAASSDRYVATVTKLAGDGLIK